MKNNWLPGIASLLMIGLVAVSFTSKRNAHAGVAKIKTIIIDAGHGFKGSMSSPDGAHGPNSQEDVISYEVAKKVVAELKRLMPEVQVLETRPTPFFIGLRERANFANENKGNLFVSIHCNSAAKLREVRREGSRTETYYVKGKGKKKIKKTRTVPVYKTYYHPNPANGTETYVFAAHKQDDKEDILMENGDVFQNEKDDSTAFNTNINDPIVKQQVALWTKQFFASSVKLASIVEEEFTALGRFSRGVKQRQKGIWVLQATAMPSILIELGFITNPDEEAFLLSENGQLDMATSITRSIKRYKDLVEKPVVQNAVETKRK